MSQFLPLIVLLIPFLLGLVLPTLAMLATELVLRLGWEL